MGQLVVNIDDATLEQRLFQCAEKEHKDISTVIKEALVSFFINHSTQGLVYRKLDPTNHLTRYHVSRDVSNNDEIESNPFLRVTDAEEYASHLRDSAWK